MGRGTRSRALIAGAVVGVTVALGAPGAFAAAPDCPGNPPRVKTLFTGQGTLESVIVDRRGQHLYFTSDAGLLRLDRPRGRPTLITPIASPGGLAFDDDGYLIVGYGNSPENGQVGDVTGPSGLLRVNPATGASEVYATGLSMANGVARAPDGSYYASNDFGMNIDRIQNGVTERGWSHVDSGNGMTVDRAGNYLYVAQTFRPAAIQRIDLANPANVTPYFTADPEDIAAGFDGMTRDDDETIFVAANGAGQVWRFQGANPPSACVLLRGLPAFPDGPSAVATGHMRGPFPGRNLYVVAFNGTVLELFDVARSR
jgi:sugar lactone lactonase YvrE